MNRYKASAQLRNTAKDKMAGKYGSAISIMLLSMIITNIASRLCSYAFPSESMAGFILYNIVSFILSVVLGVFNVGMTYFYLNAACGLPCSAGNLFYGFREQPNKALALSLVYTALQYVCLMPMQYMAQLYLTTRDARYLSYMLIAMAAGLVIYIPVTLALSQIFFLMLDFPEWSVTETLMGSIRSMRGHKMRLFLLELSFLPLILLSLLSLGIGLLWLLPYMNMTLTHFFLDLMNPAAE